jgi:hypothetical protein
MTELTAEYTTSSGTPPSNGMTQPVDNRIRLEVDGRQVEAWELTVMESQKISECMLVFARYMVNASGKLSPDLPNAPLDELTAEQRQQIKNSAAYKALKRFKLPDLNKAARSFLEQAVAGF